MLLTKEVEVTLIASNVEYYKKLGYEIPMKKATESTYRTNGYKKYVYDLFKKIKVKVDDLPNRSNAKVEVNCDNCETISIIPYSAYKITTEKYLPSFSVVIL